MSTTEQKIICIDATELDNFDLCKFRWDAFHHQYIKPKNMESHFETGIFLHYLLELYYKGKKKYSTVTAEHLEHIIELGRIESVKYEMNLAEIGDTIFQLREYARYYVDENIVPIHIEEPFMVEIYRSPELIIYISGKPDLIFAYGNSSQANVMDHKRVSRETEITSLRNQFNMYAAGIKTDTVIVNKVGFQKSKKPHERFLRTPFIYSPEIIEEWIEEVIFKVKEMVAFQESGYFPRNRTSCEKWSGCYLKRYCSSRPAVRKFLLGTEYLIGEQWDIGAKLEKEREKEKESEKT